MERLRKHSDFTDSEIDDMHVVSSSFLDLCVKLLTGENVTNCINIMAAGCLHCHLSRFKILHRHSQQGWEAMNQKLKHFYFNDTNHRGCGGNKNGAVVSDNHVLPLVRMCQRFVMWKLGIGDAFFMSKKVIIEQTKEGTIEEDRFEFGEL